MNQNLDTGLRNNSKFLDQNCAPPCPSSSNLGPDLSTDSDGDSSEDSDFSNVVLKYIRQILMEEDKEERPKCITRLQHHKMQTHLFYELLGEKHSSSPSAMTTYVDQNHECGDEIHPSCSSHYTATLRINSSIRGSQLCNLKEA